MKSQTIVIVLLLVILGLCCCAANAQNYKPEQIRIELTGSEDEITIIYTTGSSTNSDFKIYTTVPPSQLFYGTTTIPQTKVAGTSIHYEYLGYRADIHSVTITGLTPGTR